MNRISKLALFLVFIVALAQIGIAQDLNEEQLEGEWRGSDGNQYIFEVTATNEVNLCIVVNEERPPKREVNTAAGIVISFTGAEIMKGLSYQGTYSRSGFRLKAPLTSQENFHSKAIPPSVLQAVLARQPEFNSVLNVLHVAPSTIELTRYLTFIKWKGQAEVLEVMEEFERVPVSLEKVESIEIPRDDGLYRLVRKNCEGQVYAVDAYSYGKLIWSEDTLRYHPNGSPSLVVRTTISSGRRERITYDEEGKRTEN